jgi:hypothetical protein
MQALPHNSPIPEPIGTDGKTIESDGDLLYTRYSLMHI